MQGFKLDDFRIEHDVLYGYKIQKRNTISDESFEWRFFSHMGMPVDEEGIIGHFTTKSEAIKFIKDLCTETEYYYPPEFEIPNNE